MPTLSMIRARTSRCHERRLISADPKSFLSLIFFLLFLLVRRTIFYKSGPWLVHQQRYEVVKLWLSNSKRFNATAVSLNSLRC